MLEKLVGLCALKYHAFKSDKRAVTALEYGLVAALIAVVIITVVTKLGSNLCATFNKIATTIN